VLNPLTTLREPPCIKLVPTPKYTLPAVPVVDNPDESDTEPDATLAKVFEPD
jgi:hypothetical protein